jgi:DNA-directed RNA polymerase subunit RPC12/RpoP
METDKIVVYKTFIDPNNAHIVKGLLDSYGIECFLSDENMVTLNAMYSSAVGGVKLNVFEKDLNRISAILESENMTEEETTESEKEESEITCPICHSANIAFGGSVKRKFGLSTVVIFSVITSFLLMVYPFSLRKVYHCFDCGHEFKKQKLKLSN